MQPASTAFPFPSERAIRVRVDTFGCRANKYDSAKLRGALTARGYALVGPDDPFDVLVLNTCTVTAAADSATRRLLRHHRRTHPEAILAITGCLAAVAGEQTLKTLEVDVVLPNRDADTLLAALDAYLVTNQGTGPTAPPARPPHDGQLDPRPATVPLPDLIPAPGRHSRFFFKIQDGCNVHCTFCIIPQARGLSRSVCADEVIQTVNAIYARGYRETILSGINLGAWGHDLQGKPTLATLIRRILDETPVERLRLGSLEPWSVRDDLIAMVGSEPRLLPSLHIPLQSGALPILNAMRRPSTPARYRATIEKLRAVRPDLTLWLDVIVGFPGETEALFQESLDFVSRLEFTKLHVFPYSSREGTPAATLPDQVPGPVKRERVARFLALSRSRFTATLTSRVGSTDEMLVEVGGKGHTRDNLPVRLEARGASAEPRQGEIVSIQIGAVENETLRAHQI